MKATNEYVSTLFELKEATIAENIVWKRLNKDTYTYKVMNDDLEDLIITIKKISDKAPGHFVLSLVKKDFESSELLMNLDTTTTNEDLRDQLEELYEFIEYHVDLRSLDGLRSFIDVVNDPKTRTSLD
ncbi:MAG TPA: hypothetical protein DEQ34_08120 [Balneolaceae bacterium]|nr:hypothetical protein [Balneolaceae bacterium]|tara:strand:+ start:81769 stop:82152 length:384 start_codon:yes stop_codon:yes gene_type:complete